LKKKTYEKYFMSKIFNFIKKCFEIYYMTEENINYINAFRIALPHFSRDFSSWAWESEVKTCIFRRKEEFQRDPKIPYIPPTINLLT